MKVQHDSVYRDVLSVFLNLDRPHDGSTPRLYSPHLLNMFVKYI